MATPSRLILVTWRTSRCTPVVTSSVRTRAERIRRAATGISDSSPDARAQARTGGDEDDRDPGRPRDLLLALQPRPAAHPPRAHPGCDRGWPPPGALTAWKPGARQRALRCPAG